MIYPVIKRSVVINGHKTSVSLEDPFFDHAKLMAAERNTTMGALVSILDGDPGKGNLSSKIRLMVVADLRKRAGLVSEPAKPSVNEVSPEPAHA